MHESTAFAVRAKMFCTSLLALTSTLLSANCQQGQNFYYTSGDNRDPTRFLQFQPSQFSAASQPFASFFPQTNAGPFQPFRSPSFQIADGNAITSSQKFQSQQPPYSVPSYQISSQPVDSASDPRFDPLISSPGVFSTANSDDYADTSYAEQPPETPPSQRFNSPERQSHQFRNNNQLARFSPVAISEVTRTQDSPNSPNVLQTHSFNVHHTTRHPEQLPLTQNSRWRTPTGVYENENFGHRGRNIPIVQQYSSARPATVDVNTENVFPKHGNRFAAKEQTFLVNTHRPDLLESSEAQPDSDSTIDHFVAHDSYYQQGEKKKEATTKSKVGGNSGRGKTTTHITSTPFVTPSIIIDNRVRSTTLTTELADSDAAVTTLRSQNGVRYGQGQRGRNKYARPAATEADKSAKNANKGKVSAAGVLKHASTETDENVHFDVVTMSQDHVFVLDDNFRGFVDSASIDSTEAPATEDIKEALEGATVASVSVSHAPVKKKVLPPVAPTVDEENGSTTKLTTTTTESTTERTKKSTTSRATETPTTSTEGWIIVASVQTSRSVSGARFIPSSAIKQEQHPLPLDAKSIKDIKSSAHNKSADNALSETISSRRTSGPRVNTTTKSSSTLSTESIIDKLDQVQSDLSSGILNAFPPHEKLPVDPVDATPSSKSTTSAAASSEEPYTRRFSPSSKTTPKQKVDRNKSLFDSVQFDDLTGLLPPGFKTRNFSPKSGGATRTTKVAETSAATTSTTVAVSATTDKTGSKNKTKTNLLSSLKSKIKFEDAGHLLPPGYKGPADAQPSSVEPPKKPSIEEKVPDLLSKAKPVDISAFLPPGFKLNSTVESSTQLQSVLSKIEFKEANDLVPPDFTTESTTKSSTTVTKTTTAKAESNSSKVVFPSRPGGNKKPQSAPKSGGKPGLLSYQIPTIHKGWPVRPTTEFAGWPTPSPSPISIEKVLQALKESEVKESNAESESSSSTSSTSTTTTTTTTTRRPTTPGICSHDCDLAGSIKLISGAKWVPELLDHNTKEWRSLANDVERQLEIIFQSSETLSQWYRRITIDAFSPGSVIVDYFVELSDLGRTVNTADMKRLFHETLIQEMVTSDTFISSNGSDYQMLRLGRFTIEPSATDFVVLPRSVMPAVRMTEQDMWLPQWAIAVIVIGLASLLFVLIFGITVVISRHKNAKKHPTALTEEMLNELNKSHMGGFENYGADDLYNMEDVWNEKPFKKRSSYYQDGSMPNIYDSWRSDWNGYYGNSYYNDSVRSGYSRRRSDYDTNF